MFYLWNVISCFHAISPPEAIMQSQLVFLSLAVYLMISAFINENREFENIFIKIQLLVLLFAFGLAFYKMGSLPFYDPYKIISISANNNLFTGFLLLSFPLVITGYSINKGFWKFLSVFTGIITLFFIIIVQSRAAYTGLFFSIVLTCMILIIKYRSVWSKKNIIVGAIAFLILISGVFVFYSSLDATRKNYFLSKIPVWEYFRSYEDLEALRIAKQKLSAGNDHSHIPDFDFAEDYYENANLRLIFWKKSLCLIESNPVMGVGAGNWKLNIPSCKNPPNPDHTLKNYTYSQPHNEWISFISELGITGFILSLFVFILPLIIVLYRIFFVSVKPHVSVAIYVSFIFGFYLFSVFDFPLKRVEHNVLLFSLFAFIFYKVPLKQDDAGFIHHSPRKIFTFLVVLLLLLSLCTAFIRLRSEYYTLKIFRNERRNDENVIKYCQKAENIFYRITPNTLPVAWFEGVAWYRKGNLSSAEICFRRALNSTPYEVRVLNDYGITLYNLNRTQEAKSVLLYSIGIDPYFDDAKFNLGAIYFLTGKKDSALIYIRTCRDSGKRKDFLEELE